jgi:hypothetical protein
MRSALYYPHTEIENVGLLKTALLLWDQLEFIVPYPAYEFSYQDRLVAEAVELVGVKHSPSDEEKKQAHEYIEDFVTQPLPEPFYYFHEPQKETTRSEYEIWPQKLLSETWRMLQDAQLAGKPGGNFDYPFSQPAGLSIMAILADCCAGKTRSRVTDENAAYATLTGLLGSQAETSLNKPQASYEQLVPITLEVIDPGGIDLRKLIDFRKREAKSGGSAIRELRHNYLDGIEEFVTTLTTTKGSASDEIEIKRQFTLKMKDDLTELRRELGSARNEALLSKEMLLTTIALIGTVAAAAFAAPLVVPEVVTWGGTIVSIGGLLGVGNKYQSSRREILKKHKMAYLQEMASPRLALR